MKKILSILCVLICIHITNTSFACDVCGCSLGGYYFGILPQYTSHFIGLRYSQARFRAEMNHDSEYLENEYSEDTYRRIDWMGRYSFNKKLQLNFMVPYLMNDMNGSHQVVHSNGIGDPSLLLYYTFFNTGEELLKTWQHSLQAGGGMKFPLGNDEKTDKGTLINRNFQLGTGSFDFLLSSIYTIRRDKIGLNIESTYKINTENKQDYRFGNQFNVSGNFFYWFETPGFTVLPFLGMYYENAARHTEGKVTQINTGGTALFASLGTQLYYRNFTLGLTLQQPLRQDYYSEETVEIESKSRFMVTLIYNFSLKRKDDLFKL